MDARGIVDEPLIDTGGKSSDMKLPQRIMLVIISGLLVPLCLPPFGWWPLLLLCYPPLLIATMGTTPRRSFYLGLLQGVIGYGATLYWLFNIFALTAIPLFVIMACFSGLFCMLFNAISKQKLPPIINVIIAGVLWTGIEFYRSELFFLRFPWVTPGTALGPTFLSPLLGVYGTSFLILTAAAAVINRRTRPFGVILSVCVLSLGVYRPERVEAPAQGEGITVTVVQSETSYMPDYIELTRKAATNAPDLVIWPEYALPYDVRKSISRFPMLTNICAELDAIFVVGTKTVIGSGVEDWHNTALILNKGGVIGEYYKTRPVHFFNDGIPGESFAPIQTELGTFSTPICFDCDYSEVARTMVSQGAEFFAAPSFDAKSWSANQHLQHSLFFRLRAAENGRWVACAASSGVSQIIDPHGHVHASIPPMEAGVTTYRIARLEKMTPFTRGGWIFPWIALAGTAILMVTLVVMRFVKRETA